MTFRHGCGVLLAHHVQLGTAAGSGMGETMCIVSPTGEHEMLGPRLCCYCAKDVAFKLTGTAKFHFRLTGKKAPSLRYLYEEGVPKGELVNLAEICPGVYLPQPPG